MRVYISPETTVQWVYSYVISVGMRRRLKIDGDTTVCLHEEPVEFLVFGLRLCCVPSYKIILIMTSRHFAMTLIFVHISTA